MNNHKKKVGCDSDPGELSSLSAIRRTLDEHTHDDQRDCRPWLAALDALTGDGR